MKILTLTPQGLFEEDDTFNPLQQTCVPVALRVDGFPVSLEIKSLKGLTYHQRKQACYMHKRQHQRLGYTLFSTHVKDHLVMAWVENKSLHACLNTLNSFSFPIGSLSLSIFVTAKDFLKPTLHVKELPYGKVRLTYIENKIPYLVRFVDQHRKNAEIQETLHYIQQTYHDQPVTITERQDISKTWKILHPWGINSLWRLYWWPRALSVMGLFFILLLGGHIAFMTYEKSYWQQHGLELQSQKTTLSARLKNSPQDINQRYHRLHQVKGILKAEKASSYKNLIKALSPLTQKARFYDIEWRPKAHLKLLTGFSSWQDLTDCENFLRTLWPQGKLTKNHQPTASKDMIIQWDIRF